MRMCVCVGWGIRMKGKMMRKRENDVVITSSIIIKLERKMCIKIESKIKMYSIYSDVYRMRLLQSVYVY